MDRLKQVVEGKIGQANKKSIRIETLSICAHSNTILERLYQEQLSWGKATLFKKSHLDSEHAILNSK